MLITSLVVATFIIIIVCVADIKLRKVFKDAGDIHRDSKISIIYINKRNNTSVSNVCSSCMGHDKNNKTDR